ncbi:group 1 glycosyl transferase [Methanocaldococcus villosus KIN24-T80]|uniref:Group 1 glycosyl transferase n=1 Tax=Methanocaldococcus villosus KIN24-T80 TaxID=1069083 RepID=N6VQD3_9EURY|nr:glycosyltransferase family 4 protein [Methanocaldococcus villosus]ENN96075.1 group 1 glycosyl transferase [Methanocaldococcus villosus KIN24-T80]
MKIAMVTWEYPPKIVGGLAIHCKGLAEALVKLGHEVDIITADHHLPEYENIRGVNVYRVRPLTHSHFLTYAILMAEEMEKKIGILKRDYDVVHCHDWMTHFVGANLKHVVNMPYVQSIHSTEQGRCGGIHSEDSRTIAGIEYLSTYEACQVITVSKSLKDEICYIYNVPEDKVRVIYNGINPEEFDIEISEEERLAIRRNIGVYDHEIMILYVGRLTYQKGVEYLIRAMPIILSKFPNAKLVIAGNGDMRGYLEDLSYRVGVRDRVIFLGFVGGDFLPKLYKASDIVVIPSIYEPFGIVALEAMAAGKPVVATSVGGLREIIKHEYNGIWVYPYNPESIAWGVERVLSDEGLRKYIINNAKKEVYEKYSWMNIAKETVKVYETAINMMR